MNSQRIAPHRPLPPQRWSFLPTSEFWHLAALTPISIIFWVGVAVCFSLIDFVALVWWQQALVFMTFYSVWGGLVERYSRRYLARRQLRGLAGPRTDLEDTPVAAPTSQPAPLPQRPDPSLAPVPHRKSRSRLQLVSRPETWDLAYARLFGRGAPIARLAFNLAFGLAIFHPSWSVKLTALLALFLAALGLGSWEQALAAAAAPRPARDTSLQSPNALDRPGYDTPERALRASPRE